MISIQWGTSTGGLHLGRRRLESRYPGTWVPGYLGIVRGALGRGPYPYRNSVVTPDIGTWDTAPRRGCGSNNHRTRPGSVSLSTIACWVYGLRISQLSMMRCNLPEKTCNVVECWMLAFILHHSTLYGEDTLLACLCRLAVWLSTQ